MPRDPHSLHASRLRALLALAFVAIASACTSGSVLHETKKPEPEPTVADKSQDSGGTRPTDDGETVPGYFLRPADLAVDYDDSTGQYAVSAPSGAIGDSTGAPGRSSLYLWQLQPAAFEALTYSTTSATSVPATLLATLVSQPDGSLDAHVAAASDGALVLVTTPSATDSQLDVPAGDGRAPRAAARSAGAPQGFVPLRASALLWTAAQIQRAAAEHEINPNLSDLENSHYTLCYVTRLAERVPYHVFDTATDLREIGKYLDVRIADDECIFLALTVASDSPDSHQPYGFWTVREASWFHDSCKDGTYWTDGQPSPGRVCTCYVDTLSADISFDSLSRSIGDSLDAADPNVTRCAN